MFDFVLTNPEWTSLETESAKVRFFCERLKVHSQFLPAKTYPGKFDSRPTIRYIVDKFPMYVGDESLSLLWGRARRVKRGVMRPCNAVCTDFRTPRCREGFGLDEGKNHLRNKFTADKTQIWAGATPLSGASAAQNFVGSLPPTPRQPSSCFVRVQSLQPTVCNADRITIRKKKRRTIRATAESTIQRTQNYHPSAPPG